MIKQPSMYNLLGGYKVIYLPGSKYAWHINKGFKAFWFTHFVGKPAGLCFITLTISFFAGFQPVRKSLAIDKNRYLPQAPLPWL
ncbi:hypothetical protein [Paraflavitalea speifideaquila]|uniref:hypothetical protein n=1 Tax=Paraflavitalea speifideaquila TaxID=3076558 RepID=UPI0028EE89B7|nr:hypothetical protein [Paraflavitalea speifideiaquila]